MQDTGAHQQEEEEERPEWVGLRSALPFPFDLEVLVTLAELQVPIEPRRIRVLSWRGGCGRSGSAEEEGHA